MSPCEATLAEIRSTTCNNVEKRLWLEAKGTVRRLGEIPQLEVFPSRKCGIKVPDSEVKMFLGTLIWADDQREFTVFKE